MPKKTARSAKSNSQRSREEQWKRRAAAQGVIGSAATSGATLDREDAVTDEEADSDGVARAASPTPRASALSAARAGTASRVRASTSATSSMAARRPAQTARAGRMRLAANAMSLDEEMRYVRSDIRLLIILTAVCLVVLVALSFVIR